MFHCGSRGRRNPLHERGIDCDRAAAKATGDCGRKSDSIAKYNYVVDTSAAPEAAAFTKYDEATYWKNRTGKDVRERDPRSWRLLGSDDEVDWVLIDNVQDFEATSNRKALAFAAHL